MDYGNGVAMAAPIIFGNQTTGSYEMRKTFLRQLPVLVLVLYLLAMSTASCFNDARKPSDCQSILAALVAFGYLGEEAIRSNPDLSAQEQNERLQAFRGLQPAVLSIYVDCLNDIPDNPNNPLEYF